MAGGRVCSAVAFSAGVAVFSSYGLSVLGRGCGKSTQPEEMFKRILRNNGEFGEVLPTTLYLTCWYSLALCVDDGPALTLPPAQILLGRSLTPPTGHLAPCSDLWDAVEQR